MTIKPLRPDLQKYLIKHNLVLKFNKQIKTFKNNPRHPSLHTGTLEPKSLKLHSFRIDRKYRVVFGTTIDGKMEIVDINVHYR